MLEVEDVGKPKGEHIHTPKKEGENSGCEHGFWWLSRNCHMGPMNTLSWNWLVLRSSPTISNLKVLVWHYNPDIIFLMEIKNKNDFCEKIRRMDYAKYVKEERLSEWLALWWNKNISMVVNYKTESIIDYIILLGTAWGLSRIT